MGITASQVMKLREATGLGMMTCKKALIAADGNMEKAIDDLRKQGQATAAKRAGKTANEGKVEILIKEKDALIYEVNSETDFVARNEDFLQFVTDLGTVITDKKPTDLKDAMAIESPLFNNQTIEAKTLEIVGKIGEKISLRRFQLASFDPGKHKVFSYIHGEGKIGVMVILESDRDKLDDTLLKELGKDIAMQIAASKPLSVDRQNVPEKTLNKEKEIFEAQVASSGKPEKIWDKIVTGKLNKFFKQVVLLEQEYIRDTAMTVTDRINQTKKDLNTEISVSSFIRYERGEEE
jgi:elongation factor Ts